MLALLLTLPVKAWGRYSVAVMRLSTLYIHAQVARASMIGRKTAITEPTNALP